MKLSKPIAVAIDVGTTTIAASLLDCESGERLAMAGSLNPQREFGADVVSRLAAAVSSADNLLRMSRLINAELERLTVKLLDDCGAARHDLRCIGIAGNPAIEHLLLGLSVNSLAFPPYRPLFSAGKTATTASLGWGLDLDAYIFPLPGGFVGGDLVAFLYGEGICAPRSMQHAARLYLDLGTNGELALVAGSKIYATSAAAGPAFEGGNLACGMAALPGAISGVSFAGDKVRIATIGNEAPSGICGSGVIAAVAGLLDAGLLDQSGRLLEADEIPSNLANHVRNVDGETGFVLYRDARRTIYLSQGDIRQVQLAKGAIRAGMEVLLLRAGISGDSVQEVILTGSFGAILSPEHLKNVGIFSENMVKNAGFVHEGALRGVEKAICAGDDFAALDRLAKSIKVIPLSGTPAFEKHFLEHMNFPKMQNGA